MTVIKSYSPLPGSEGSRREFKITWGLRAGYGSAGRIYDLEEAIRAAHRWMRERHARGAPFLSGMFTRGEVVTRARKPTQYTNVNPSPSSPARFSRYMPGISP